MHDYLNLIDEKVLLFIAVPLVSGLIGWGTNYIAVQMLFHPKNPIRFFGLEIVGLIPKRKAEIASNIAETVEKELISHSDIQQALSRPEFQREIAHGIEKQVERVIREKLGQNPIVAVFLQGEAANMIRSLFVDQITSAVPDFIEQFLGRMEEHLDFRELVEKKIQAFDTDHLEAVVMRIARHELKTIEYLGGILGFAVGLAQLLLLKTTSLF
ncbi:MAG: DUF445 family protein [bacterium]|nr:DUF445 family protein [bacterium]